MIGDEVLHVGSTSEDMITGKEPFTTGHGKWSFYASFTSTSKVA